VAGLAEPLVELSASTPTRLVRLAWHLGNRHTDMQICAGKLRFRPDHVLEEMATRLGATLVAIEAPFVPEPRAPSGADHEHVDDDRRGPTDRRGG
jgi:urease accessory protein